MRSTINQIIQEFLVEEPSYFLVEAEEKESSMRIILDSDNGVKIDKCSRLTRRIIKELEEEADYLDIQVSSSGLELSLDNDRQWKKNIGRLLSIKTKQGLLEEGRLVMVSELEITLKKEDKSLLGVKREVLDSVTVMIEF